MKKIGDLYEAYVHQEKEFQDLSYFYDNIPRTYGEAIEESSSLPRISINPEISTKLKTILIDYHTKLGLLTPKVKENIEKIDSGVVLAGQQATIFGGTGIIGNKISAISNISEISRQN